MSKASFVSVILPTYNRAYCLKRAIESVLCQTFSNFELIIVDDGSTDGTNAIVNEYKDRVKVVTQENRGVSHARNTGVKMATGSWLAFLDSDDTWQPQKLEKQLGFISDNPEYNWIHCDEVWIRNGRRVNPKNKHKKPSGNIYSQCLLLCCVSPSAVMIRKEVFQNAGGFREDFPVCEDYDLWLKLAKDNEIGFIEDAFVTKYGGHDDQLSKYVGIDLYRLKSLVWQLENLKHSAELERKITELISVKYEILESGYQKHGRVKELSYLRSNFTKFIENKAVNELIEIERQ